MGGKWKSKTSSMQSNMRGWQAEQPAAGLKGSPHLPWFTKARATPGFPCSVHNAMHDALM